MEKHQETPDFEVEADDWQEQQDTLRDAVGVSESEADIAAMECQNSCDALRILDGVVTEREEA